MTSVLTPAFRSCVRSPRFARPDARSCDATSAKESARAWPKAAERSDDAAVNTPVSRSLNPAVAKRVCISTTSRVSSGVWLAITIALRNIRDACSDEPVTASRDAIDDSRNAAICTTALAAENPMPAKLAAMPAAADAAARPMPPRVPSIPRKVADCASTLRCERR